MHMDPIGFYFLTEMLNLFLILHSVYHKQLQKSGNILVCGQASIKTLSVSYRVCNATRSQSAAFDLGCIEAESIKRNPQAPKLAVHDFEKPQHSNTAGVCAKVVCQEQ